MKRRSLILLSTCVAILLPSIVGMFVEVQVGSPFWGIAEGVPSTFYATVCPPMGQSLPPCGEKDKDAKPYPKCTDVPNGCCEYSCNSCRYVKACDNNYYEICGTGKLEEGEKCDNASGKCYSL